MVAVAEGFTILFRPKSFYWWMALAFLFVAVLGFVPTYWAPMAAGTFTANPVIHIHAMIFFTWTLFFLVQTSLVQIGQTARHRAFGLVGISLATLMCVFGVLAALNSLVLATALGAGSAGEAFIIVPLSAIAMFAVLTGVAVANVKRPEIHKRLMLLATVAILDGPLLRPLKAWVFTDLPPGPPPVSITLWASALTWIFIIAALAHDWRTRGRLHSVYLVGGGFIVIVGVLRLPVSELPAWRSVAASFLSLAGVFPHQVG